MSFGDGLQPKSLQDLIKLGPGKILIEIPKTSLTALDSQKDFILQAIAWKSTRFYKPYQLMQFSDTVQIDVINAWTNLPEKVTSLSPKLTYILPNRSPIKISNESSGYGCYFYDTVSQQWSQERISVKHVF